MRVTAPLDKQNGNTEGSQRISCQPSGSPTAEVVGYSGTQLSVKLAIHEWLCPEQGSALQVSPALQAERCNWPPQTWQNPPSPTMPSSV